MAQKEQTTIIIKAIQQGFDKVALQLKKQKKAQDDVAVSARNTGRAIDATGREIKGVAGISSSATKNFSKMQQNLGGGDGAGGLVRAYALLAANVFAVTAAFGVLSRSAQIDKLTESMEILSVKGGQDIENLSRKLVEASGNAVALDQAFRQVSLASSAGLDSSEIEGLTQVARGAALSLGRDLPDALDRIFRGAIKLEPEILDEIGLFVRVDEASRKYAQSLGRSVQSLSQAEKRQAFLNEILEQGTEKFSEYNEAVQPDAFTRLAASFIDITQATTSFLNKFLSPVIGLLADSKVLLTGVFLAIAGSLLKSAVPALGQFTAGIADTARESLKNAQDYQKDMILKADANMAANLKIAKQDEAASKNAARLATEARKSVPSFRSQAGDAKKIDENLKKATKTNTKLEAVNKRIDLLEKKTVVKKEKSKRIIAEELKLLKEEQRLLSAALKKEKELEATINRQVKARKGSTAQRRIDALENRAAMSGVIAGAVGTAEIEGMGAGFKQLNADFAKLDLKGKSGLTRSLGKSFFYLRGAIGIAAIGFQDLLSKAGPYVMLFGAIIGATTFLFTKFADGVKEVKKLEESLGTLGSMLEKIEDRFDKQIERINEAGISYTEFIDRQAAFSTSSVELSKNMQSVLDDLEKFQQASGFAMNAWQGFLSIFNLDKESKSIEAVNEGIKEIINSLFEEGRDAQASSLVETALGIDGQIGSMGGAEAFKTAATGVEAYENAVKSLSMIVNMSGTDLGTFEQVIGESEATMSKTHTSMDRLTVGLRDQARANIKTIETFEEANTETGKFVFNQEQLNKIVEENIKQEEARQQQLQGLSSALKGASEAIGKFQSGFLPKTKVDEILGSFQQIDGQIEQMLGSANKLSDAEITRFFEEIVAGDNQLSAIVGEDNIGKIKAALTGEDGPDFVTAGKIIAGITDEFRAFQAAALNTANAVKILADENKLLNSVLKAGLDTSAAMMQNRVEIAEKQLELSKTNQTVLARTMKIDETQIENKVKQFKIDLAAGKLKDNELVTSGQITEAQAIALINGQEAVDLKQRELNIQERIKKEIDDNNILNKEALQAAQAAFNVRKKTLEAEISLEETKQKLRKFEFGGSSAIETAEKQLEIASQKAIIEFESLTLQSKIQQAEMEILKIRLQVLAEEKKDSDPDESKRLLTLASQIGDENSGLIGTIAKGLTSALENTASKFALSVAENFKKNDLSTAAGVAAARATSPDAIEANLKDQLDDPTLSDEQVKAIQAQIKALDELDMTYLTLTGTVSGYAAQLSKLGPEGEFLSTVLTGTMAIAESFQVFKNSIDETSSATDKFIAGAAFAADAVSQIGSMLQASSKAQVAEIDQQIEAEKKRDGKSKESLQKISAMEKKKEAIQKKAFEQNKKMQIASAVINTASAIVAALDDLPFPANVGLAVMIGALGAAQVSLIKKQQFQGGGGEPETPSASLTIGKSNSAVDVSKRATAGELNFLRGGRTTGQDLGGAGSSFPGAAMGRKGYADGGVIVGERGPEVITPSAPVDITPNFGMGGGLQNVNFTINAVDAAGVEDVLTNQRGNIIRMLREAANENGELFMENVDTQVYGSST